MARITRLFVLGAVVVGGSALLRRRKTVAAPLDRAPAAPFDHVEPAVASGIANVVPQSLERLPQPGVNVP